MIDREFDGIIIYQVRYRLKNGKRARMAYSGGNKDVYEQVIAELERRDDIRPLSKTVTLIYVTLFD